MQNKYYTLIEQLYIEYDIAAGTSLHTFIKKKFIKRKWNKPFQKKAIDLITTQHVKMMLEKLIEQYYITWKAGSMKKKSSDFDKTLEYINLLGTEKDGIQHTFENIYVEIQLTAEHGLDYAAKIVNDKRLRNSTIRTNRWIIALYILLFLATIFSGAIQFLQYQHLTK
jgi:hypothetical protein